jgi:hypothetical protein
MNSGSVLSFHVCTTCGFSPNARQTDDCDRPVSSAIDLVDQCVFCPGLGASASACTPCLETKFGWVQSPI